MMHPFGSDLLLQAGSWNGGTRRFPQLVMEKQDLPRQRDGWCCGFGVYVSALFFMNFFVENRLCEEKGTNQLKCDLVFLAKTMELKEEGRRVFCTFPKGRLQNKPLSDIFYLGAIRTEFFILCDRIARFIHVEEAARMANTKVAKFKASVYYRAARKFVPVQRSGADMKAEQLRLERQAAQAIPVGLLTPPKKKQRKEERHIVWSPVSISSLSLSCLKRVTLKAPSQKLRC